MIYLGLMLGFMVGYFLCAILTASKIADLMAENETGVWKINSDGYYPYCSRCGYEPPYVREADMRTPYCPMCRAKMRKEVED